MIDGFVGDTAFFTCVGSRAQARRARLLLDSIRAFGGGLRDCPFWVVEGDPEGAPCGDERHRVFLHQAVLSAVVATSADRGAQ